MFYAIYIISNEYEWLDKCQYLSLIPLGFILVYMYRLSCGPLMKMLYGNKYIGWCVNFLGGLCLEIYIVQIPIITDRYNSFFPLNIPIVFVCIVVMAYLLRCCSRFLLQTFQDGDYNWKNIFKLC